MPHLGAADRLPHGLDQAADEIRPGRTQANGPAAAQTEPTQPDPAQPDPAQPDPAQPDPAALAPAQSDPAETANAEIGAADLCADPGPTNPGPAVDAGGSAVVATWPATSRTRLPVCVSYIDVRPAAPGRPAIS
jgi:hypothetical protein